MNDVANIATQIAWATMCGCAAVFFIGLTVFGIICAIKWLKGDFN